MNLIQRFGKKKVMVAVGVSLLVLIGIGTGVWYANEQAKKQKTLDSIDIVFKEDAMIEYGQEKVDFNDFIKEKKGEPKITLPTDKIDTKKLGKKEIVYVLSKDGYSKNKNLTIEVKDTKAPEIILKEETVTLEYGSEYDIKENIESVKDPIDGDIPYSKSDEENNYYTIEGTVDKSTSGDYTVTIKAVDKNKQVSKKTYTIHVNDKQAEEQNNSTNDGTSGNTSSNISSGSSYTPPTNNGGNGGSYTPPSNNGGGNSGGSTTPPPTTCTANGQWKMIASSGVAFYTWEEADSYGDQHVPEGYYYSVIMTKDICGKDGYSPSWQKLQ